MTAVDGDSNTRIHRRDPNEQTAAGRAKSLELEQLRMLQ